MDLRKLSVLLTPVFVVSYLVVAAALFAQSSYGDQDTYKGFSAYEEFRASTSNLGQLLIVDTNLGYDFNRHAGFDVGIPIFFARGSLASEFVTGRPNRWRERLGDPYLDLRLTAENPVLNYATVITGSVPASHGGEFSTGRVGGEWFNHFDRPIDRLIPFVNVSVSNGVLNTRLLSHPFRLDRPFRTLGFLTNFEEGADLNIWHSFTVGGAAYQFVPAGRQQSFGSLTQSASPQGIAASAQELRSFTHDRGFSSWIRFDPTRFLFTEVGYDHSIRLRQDSASITIGVNLRSLFGKTTVHH